MSHIIRPKGPEDLTCPLLEQPMSEVCHKCPLWTPVDINAKDPQTGEKITAEWRCALAWLPVVGLIQAQETHKAQADLNTMRNEFHTFAKALMVMTSTLAEVHQTLLETPATGGDLLTLAPVQEACDAKSTQ